MFPNTSPLARQPRTLAVWASARPAPDRGLALGTFVDADAPAEVKDFLRHYYIRYSGPSGLTEQDDMENWNYAHKASRGTIGAAASLQLRDGPRPLDACVRGPRVEAAGEHQRRHGGDGQREQPRGFYRRWRQFMEAATWNDLT